MTEDQAGQLISQLSALNGKLDGLAGHAEDGVDGLAAVNLALADVVTRVAWVADAAGHIYVLLALVVAYLVVGFIIRFLQRNLINRALDL